MVIKNSLIPFLIASFFIIIIWIRGVEFFDESFKYLSAIQSTQGKEPILLEKNYYPSQIPILLNPAPTLFAAGVGLLLNSELAALALSNAILYLVAVIFFYKLSLLVFNGDQNKTIISTVLFAGNYSILRFGPGAYLMDMGGWTFFVISLYFAIKFFYSEKDSYAYLAALFSSVGLFFKESGGVGIFTLFLLILFSNLTIRRKLGLIFKSGSILAINVAYHILIFNLKGYLYFDRLKLVATTYGSKQTVMRTIKVMGYLFNVGWPFALIGAWNSLKRKVVSIKDHQKIFVAMVPSALSFLIYPAYDPKMAFVSVPLLSLLATTSLSKLKSKKMIYFILILYVIASFALLHKLSLPKGVRF